MTAEVIDFNDYKYTKIAQEFVELRATDPNAAAKYARSKVPAKDFPILSKYIDAELSRQRGSEPLEEE